MYQPFKNLKSKVDKLVAGKLVHVPVNLNKLSDVVKNDVLRKHVYSAIEDELPDISNLARKTTLDATINEVKGKIPNITNLVATISLTKKIKYLMLVLQSKRLTITQKLVKLKRQLLIMVMINILLLQNLIN